MRIGIDARFVGPSGTGLGKYSEKLIENLQIIDTKNHYAVFVRQDNWSHLKITNKNFQKVLADVPWYSVAEQLKMPAIFKEAKLDLLHVPHFNVPYFYRGKFVVTIHDLIHHNFSQESVSTKNPVVYKLKRFAYKAVIANAVKRSAKIITPSYFVKEEIIKAFTVEPEKIVVTYEAAEEEYFTNKRQNVNDKRSTILYVGNAYPHKNLNNLLDAFSLLIRTTGHRDNGKNHPDIQTTRQPDNLKLIIVCPRDIFWERLQKEIKNRNLEGVVEMKGYLNSGELSRLFSNSSAYVFPSLSEGFGIPGLNAMAANLPLISSNIQTLKEIYSDAAVYFNPDNPNDIAEKINKVITSKKISDGLIKKGQNQVKKYSWQKMAEETLKVYTG